MTETRMLLFVVHDNDNTTTENQVEVWAARLGYIVAKPRRLDKSATQVFNPDGSAHPFTPDAELWGADIVIKEESA